MAQALSFILCFVFFPQRFPTKALRLVLELPATFVYGRAQAFYGTE